MRNGAVFSRHEEIEKKINYKNTFACNCQEKSCIHEKANHDYTNNECFLLHAGGA